MSVPDDVREAAIQKLGLFFNDRSMREAVADAALSALEAAGWVCVQDDAVRHFASAIEKHERRIVEFCLSPLRDEHFATITWPNGEQTVIPVTAFRAMLTASRHKEKQDD